MVKTFILSLVFGVVFIGSAMAETTYNLYYFYNNVRCANCRAFETMAKELAPTLPVNFKLVNIQEPGNEHYLTDFKLYTKSIVIEDSNGNFKNLEKIWSYVRDEEKFDKYITDEVNQFIKDNK